MGNASGLVTALILSRSQYTEDTLDEAVSRGVKQYVILGAGMDTFAFWRPDLLEHLQVYLGSCAYICWEELNRPTFDSLQISRFEGVKPNESIILDISYTPSYLEFRLNKLLFGDWRPDYEQNKSQIDDEIVSMFVKWPLIISCSVKVKDMKHPFKPEYIIPQLLLQWITKNPSIDGIKYFSTKIVNETNNMSLYQNYVFPAKSNPKQGICEKLKKHFNITETVSWQLAMTQKNSYSDYQNNYLDSKEIELIKGLRVPYKTTDFGFIEYLLSKKMQAEPLESANSIKEHASRTNKATIQPLLYLPSTASLTAKNIP